jgi:hypothetical protein
MLPHPKASYGVPTLPQSRVARDGGRPAYEPKPQRRNVEGEEEDMDNNDVPSLARLLAKMMNDKELESPRTGVRGDRRSRSPPPHPQRPLLASTSAAAYTMGYTACMDDVQRKMSSGAFEIDDDLKATSDVGAYGDGTAITRSVKQVPTSRAGPMEIITYETEKSTRKRITADDRAKRKMKGTMTRAAFQMKKDKKLNERAAKHRLEEEGVMWRSSTSSSEGSHDESAWGAAYGDVTKGAKQWLEQAQMMKAMMHDDEV